LSGPPAGIQEVREITRTIHDRGASQCVGAQHVNRGAGKLASQSYNSGEVGAPVGQPRRDIHGQYLDRSERRPKENVGREAIGDASIHQPVWPTGVGALPSRKHSRQGGGSTHGVFQPQHRLHAMAQDFLVRGGVMRHDSDSLDTMMHPIEGSGR
jgi:hypothetical protein